MVLGSGEGREVAECAGEIRELQFSKILQEGRTSSLSIVVVFLLISKFK